MLAAKKYGNFLLSDFNDLLSAAGQVSKSEIIASEGLKTFILQDPLCTFINTSENSFKISANPIDFSKCILRDYLIGYSRVQKQWDAAQLLRNNGKLAWCVISFYYVGFFAIIDALRLRRRVLINFSHIDLFEIGEKFNGNKPRQLNSLKNAIGVFSEDFSEMSITTAGEGPHKISWNKYSEYFLSPLKQHVDVDQESLNIINICKGLNGWMKPSDIRNEWNYRDPIFFDDSAEDYGRLFERIIDDPEQAKSWIRGKHGIQSQSDKLAAMACIVQFSKTVLNKTYELGFKNIRS